MCVCVCVCVVGEQQLERGKPGIGESPIVEGWGSEGKVSGSSPAETKGGVHDLYVYGLYFFYKIL